MKTKAEIVKMPSSRVTTRELHREIELIKDNHLAHIHDCIHRLEEDVKDNRKFFTQRLDRLDNRIWWILGITVTSLISVLVAQFGGV
jgi:hypothetical protein